MVKTAGDELRAWMERTGRSYDEVAETLGISKSYISNLLTGGRTPSLALAIRIAAVTGVPVSLWAATRVDRDDMEGVASV
jgi:transcriptional regulator with XRE-family HTH domain